MIEINLWDSNFAGSACSIAGKTPRLMRYVYQQMEWDGITIFTDNWTSNPIVDKVKTKYRVFWLREPQCLHPNTYKWLSIKHRCRAVLTYHRPTYERMPNGRFAPYGGVWIPRGYWGMHPKSKLVSMLIGNKMSTEGHRLRHEIANRFSDGWGIDYYGIKGTPVGYGAATKLQVLSQYYFTIVTETCYEENLFTEILLDCFAVGTIPIFWGCPNLDKFFNAAGVLSFQTLDELEWILGQLSPGLYRARRQAAIDNLYAAADYEITEDWLVKHVFKEILDGKGSAKRT